MAITIRMMKQKIKDKLTWGTHVNTEVYELMVKYTNKQLDMLTLNIINAYKEDSKSKRITTTHVKIAIANLMLEENE